MKNILKPMLEKLPKILSRNIRGKLLAIGMLSVGVVAFQNCAPQVGITVKRVGIGFFSFSAPDCTTNPSYVACVFEKAPPLDAESIDDIPLNVGLKFVNVAVTDSSITTSDAFITDTAKQETSPEPAMLRAPASAKSPHALHKMVNFYWLNKTKAFLTKYGATTLASENISFVVDAPETGFSYEKRAIYLGKRKDAKAHSLDGGVVVHLLGEAYTTYATNGKLLKLADDNGQHMDCRYEKRTLFDRECCSSSNGCVKSISAGLSDYLVSQIFVDQTAVGEYAGLDVGGTKVCGLYRNVQKNKDLKLADAFSACESVGQPGQVYALGALYASIWYEVGILAQAQGLDVNMLYPLLLPKLEPQDTFLTVLEKIRLLDKEGKLYALFQSEYTRRGL